MNVTLRRIDGSLEKLYLQMNHGASVAEMRRAVAELTAPADRLAVVELYNNRVHKLFACTEDEKIDACYENDLIFLYEVHHPHFGRAAAAARARAAATAAATAAAAAASPGPSAEASAAAATAAEESHTPRRSMSAPQVTPQVRGARRRRVRRRRRAAPRRAARRRRVARRRRAVPTTRRRRRRGGGCGRAAALGVRYQRLKEKTSTSFYSSSSNLVGLPFCITVPADVSPRCCTPPWAPSCSDTTTFAAAAAAAAADGAAPMEVEGGVVMGVVAASTRWCRRPSRRSSPTARRRAYAGASEGASEGDAASGDAVEPAWKLHHPMSGYGGGEQTAS